MKKLIIIFALFVFSSGVFAQQERPFAGLKGDYKQVNIVAHVEIKSIKFAAPDVYPLYVMRAKVIEPFKGKIKSGQTIEFYVHIEDGENRDLSGYLKKWIVFLQGRHPIPSGGKNWYELENSRVASSLKNLDRMRRIKGS